MFSIEVNRNILKDAGFLKVEQLTPSKKKLYYQALKMKKRVKRLETSKTIFKKKLQLITKSQKNSSYLHLSNKMNKSTLNFIESQIINQQKSPNGRRYKLDDKIFALSIYKTSPKAYSFLSNIFALPVESTLNSLLSKIPFKPGVNTHIENNIRHQVSKLKPIDRTCVLMFDEMSLEPGLKYDKKNDLMLGFEYFGNYVTDKFANHVLVFMLKGICKKWKQPIAF